MRKRLLPAFHLAMAIEGIERGFMVRVDRYGNLWFRYAAEKKPKEILKVQISAREFPLEKGKHGKDHQVVIQRWPDFEPEIMRAKDFSFSNLAI